MKAGASSPASLAPVGTVSTASPLFGLQASKRLRQAAAEPPKDWALAPSIGLAMQQVPRETWLAFERRLEQAGVPPALRPERHKWVRFYLDFCHKYCHPPESPTSLGPFLAKLATKNQSPAQRHQASVAVRLLTAARQERDSSLEVSAPHPEQAGPLAATGQNSQAQPRPVAQAPRPKPSSHAFRIESVSPLFPVWSNVKGAAELAKDVPETLTLTPTQSPPSQMRIEADTSDQLSYALATAISFTAE